MIVKEDKETINESLGIDNTRAKAIGDLLRPIFDQATRNGVFDGVACIKAVEKSGAIKTQEEWYLVFFRIGIFLGGLFEKENSAKRAMEAMKQLGNAVKIEGVKRPPKEKIIN